MRKRFIICMIDDGHAVPIITHHRTKKGAIEYGESLHILNTYHWVIVKYPGFLVVHSTNLSEDVNLEMTISYNHRL